MMFMLLILLLLLTAGDSPVTRPQQDVEDWFPPFEGYDLRFTSPTDGQTVVAGDSVEIAIEVDGDAQLQMILVTFRGGGLMLQPPFRQKMMMPREWIGPVAFSAMGKTDSGSILASKWITIEAGLGDVNLLDIESSERHLWLSGPGDSRTLTIYGQYSDGIRRDISEYHTSYSLLGEPDVACIAPEAVIVGVGPGSAAVLVSHKGLQDTLLVNVDSERWMNNMPYAALEPIYEGSTGAPLCFSAAECYDFDECLGEHLGEHSFVWRLSFGGALQEGIGREYCITPDRSGIGTLHLTVTDEHGDSSQAVSIVVIE